MSDAKTPWPPYPRMTVEDISDRLAQEIAKTAREFYDRMSQDTHDDARYASYQAAIAHDLPTETANLLAGDMAHHIEATT